LVGSCYGFFFFIVYIVAFFWKKDIVFFQNSPQNSWLWAVGVIPDLFFLFYIFLVMFFLPLVSAFCAVFISLVLLEGSHYVRLCTPCKQHIVYLEVVKISLLCCFPPVFLLEEGCPFFLRIFLTLHNQAGEVLPALFFLFRL
jgi:hypothetical protein